MKELSAYFSSIKSYALYKNDYKRHHIDPVSLWTPFSRFEVLEQVDPTYCRSLICPKCTSDLGDEYHYLLVCPFFRAERKRYIPRFYSQSPSMQKYKDLLHATNESLLIKLSIFMKIIMSTIKT